MPTPCGDTVPRCSQQLLKHRHSPELVLGILKSMHQALQGTQDALSVSPYDLQRIDEGFVPLQLRRAKDVRKRMHQAVDESTIVQCSEWVAGLTSSVDLRGDAAGMEPSSALTHAELHMAVAEVCIVSSVVAWWSLVTIAWRRLQAVECTDPLMAWDLISALFDGVRACSWQGWCDLAGADDCSHLWATVLHCITQRCGQFGHVESHSTLRRYGGPSTVAAGRGTQAWFCVLSRRAAGMPGRWWGQGCTCCVCMLVEPAFDLT